jgi:hypothetical protein
VAYFDARARPHSAAGLTRDRTDRNSDRESVLLSGWWVFRRKWSDGLEDRPGEGAPEAIASDPSTSLSAPE